MTSKSLRVSFTPVLSGPRCWLGHRPPATGDLRVPGALSPSNYSSRHALQRTPEGGALERGGRAASPAVPRSPFRFGVLPNPGADISGTPGLPLTPARRHSHRSRPGGRGHLTFRQAFALGPPSVTE